MQHKIYNCSTYENSFLSCPSSAQALQVEAQMPTCLPPILYPLDKALGFSPLSGAPWGETLGRPAAGDLNIDEEGIGHPYPPTGQQGAQ